MNPCDVYGKCGPWGLCDIPSSTSPQCSCLRGFEPRSMDDLEERKLDLRMCEEESVELHNKRNGEEGRRFRWDLRGRVLEKLPLCGLRLRGWDHDLERRPDRFGFRLAVTHSRMGCDRHSQTAKWLMGEPAWAPHTLPLPPPPSALPLPPPPPCALPLPPPPPSALRLPQ
ncbi:hypothetical protein H6P81_005730 [Aristolochia fimbriata]|uniref:S-locus glycoprotein domain-containing protein n=1 Tax=Aristolochia fimbriata TaxID=158543 RepID=A0AAV7EWF9_ARIFI|nr:hypothetical protein H6P81_005730 [Aristolochia fimbriata]